MNTNVNYFEVFIQTARNGCAIWIFFGTRTVDRPVCRFYSMLYLNTLFRTRCINKS